MIEIDVDKLPKNMNMDSIFKLYRNAGLVFIDEKVLRDFGWALKQLRDNQQLTRHDWNWAQTIFLIKGRTIEYNKFQSFKDNAGQAFNPPDDVVIRDHIDMKTVDGTYVMGWIPSQEDILATDWIIVDRHET